MRKYDTSKMSVEFAKALSKVCERPAVHDDPFLQALDDGAAAYIEVLEHSGAYGAGVIEGEARATRAIVQALMQMTEVLTSNYAVAQWIEAGAHLAAKADGAR